MIKHQGEEVRQTADHQKNENRSNGDGCEISSGLRASRFRVEFQEDGSQRDYRFLESVCDRLHYVWIQNTPL